MLEKQKNPLTKLAQTEEEAVLQTSKAADEGKQTDRDRCRDAAEARDIGLERVRTVRLILNHQVKTGRCFDPAAQFTEPYTVHGPGGKYE